MHKIRVFGVLVAAVVLVWTIVQLVHDLTKSVVSEPVSVAQVDQAIEQEIALDDFQQSLPEPTELDTILDTDDFTQAYQQAAGDHTRISEYRLLYELYEQQQNDVLLPHLISRAVELRYYDDAVRYMRILLDQGTLFDRVSPREFIAVLLNVDELNLNTLSNIKALVYEYQQAGLLTDDDLAMYYALIAFAKGDVDNYGYFVEQLSGGDYRDWQIGYERARDAVFQYEEPPMYYLDGLIALELFTRGYYTIARLAAQRILPEDPRYLLSLQLLAYSNLYTHKPWNAVSPLEDLLQYDTPNAELYRFLLGVAHYRNDNPGASLIAFDQVTTGKHLTDAQRYEVLLYLQLEDSDNLSTALDELMQQPDLTPFDFYSLYDSLYFSPSNSALMSTLLEAYPTLMDDLHASCQERLGDSYGYICLFGKAGTFLQAGEDERAYRYLQLLIKRYPHKEIYQRLGDLAYQLGYNDEAKRWYIKGVISEGTLRSTTDITNEIETILKSDQK